MRVVRAFLVAMLALAFVGTAHAAELACSPESAMSCSASVAADGCMDRSGGHECLARCGPICAIVLPEPSASDIADPVFAMTAPDRFDALPNLTERPDPPPPRPNQA